MPLSTLKILVSTILFSVGVAASAASTITLTLEKVGSYASGIYDEGGAEIIAYDPATRRTFVVNANDSSVDVVDISNPATPSRIASLAMSEAGMNLGAANSVAVKNGIVAVAVENDNKQANGIVAFYSAASLELITTVAAGALPDMVTFTPNGRYVLVANEGEPSDDYSIDPEGSVTIIDLKRGFNHLRVRTATFERFNSQADSLRSAGVRIFGPGATVAQDVEPEFIAVDANSRKAWIVLQENNAVAELNIRRARISNIRPLGFKDHNNGHNPIDASNRDAGINIRDWPVRGMYQPDGAETYRRFGRTYLVTANEGDSRDYDGFSEELRVRDLADEGTPLDPAIFDASIAEDENLGRINTTSTLGDSNDDGLVDEIYTYGARSFTIWDTRTMQPVFDSGSDFEDLTANLDPANFNSTNDDNDSFDGRSDDKGPEPEGIAIGRYFGRTYAFIGLERVGGIMVYDITNPHAPVYQSYINNRNFDVDVCLQRDDEGDCLTGEGLSNPEAGDLGPEGLKFIPWYESPTYRPLLLVGNEVSGTTTIYQLRYQFDF